MKFCVTDSRCDSGSFLIRLTLDFASHLFRFVSDGVKISSFAASTVVLEYPDKKATISKQSLFIYSLNLVKAMMKILWALKPRRKDDDRDVSAATITSGRARVYLAATMIGN
jgi:hypothetical protein